MPNPRLAFRYAKSVLDLAIEKGKLEQVYADMELLQQICKGNPDFVNLLKSPVVKSDTKKKIVEAVTNGKISEITAAFNALLISKGRESNLPEITTAFISQYKEHKDIHPVIGPFPSIGSPKVFTTRPAIPSPTLIDAI